MMYYSYKHTCHFILKANCDYKWYIIFSLNSPNSVTPSKLTALHYTSVLQPPRFYCPMISVGAAAAATDGVPTVWMATRAPKFNALLSSYP